MLLHAGNLGFYGAWETLLAAARELKADGVGLSSSATVPSVPAWKWPRPRSMNVRFLPFFPASKVASVLAAGDAHVITIKRGLEGVVVPSKMYGILAAGRPIVARRAEANGRRSFGGREGFGVAVDPDNPAELVAIVRALLADPVRLAAMGRPLGLRHLDMPERTRLLNLCTSSSRRADRAHRGAGVRSLPGDESR